MWFWGKHCKMFSQVADAEHGTLFDKLTISLHFFYVWLVDWWPNTVLLILQSDLPVPKRKAIWKKHRPRLDCNASNYCPMMATWSAVQGATLICTGHLTINSNVVHGSFFSSRPFDTEEVHGHCPLHAKIGTVANSISTRLLIFRMSNQSNNC